jgi:uncharacterized protein
MPRENLSHAVGFDDAPFPRAHRGEVLVVGTAYAGLRLEGVLRTEVQRDGDDATRAVAAAVQGSRFGVHTKLVMFQGIALAGFNVIDIHGLYAALGIPVLVVARRAPDLPAIREALLTRVPGGAAKWQLVERAGAMEPLGALFVQRAGLSLEAAAGALTRFTAEGNIPEPLRVAHLIAGGVTTGESRGRA